MAKTKQNFQIYKGEVKTISVTVKTAAGALIDLSDKLFRYRVGAGPDATEWPIEKLTADMSLGGTGIVNIAFEHEDTLDIEAGKIYHELRMSDDGDNEIVIMTGDFTLDDSITNETAPFDS